jgi:hypothetical protein
MRPAGLLAAVVIAAPIAGARADGIDLRDLYRRTEALVQSLTGQDSGREVIAPPGNIDPKMAFAPPGHSGMMQVIRPTEPFQQRR